MIACTTQPGNNILNNLDHFSGGNNAPTLQWHVLLLQEDSAHTDNVERQKSEWTEFTVNFVGVHSRDRGRSSKSCGGTQWDGTSAVARRDTPAFKLVSPPEPDCSATSLVWHPDVTTAVDTEKLVEKVHDYFRRKRK